MKRTKMPVAVLTAFVLLAGACGDDDDDDTSSETTEAAAETTAQSAETTAGAADTTEATEDTTEATDGGEPTEVKTDVGIDDTTIKVGMLADLSGAFAPLVSEIVEAQKVFWDDVNEQGGIAGRQIELVIEDNGYDVAKQQEKYDAIRNEVAILSQSTGSPQTAAIAQNLVDDDLIAIPLSWYSGFAFPEIGQNAFESYTNYCMESMNGLEWLASNRDVKTIAIASWPGEYGGDGAAGAAIAAEELGLEVVFDGTGQVIPASADNPNPDQTAIISQIVQSGADAVWTTMNPTSLGSLMSGAISQGYTGIWSGNSPSYSFKLLATDLAPLLDQYYVASTYIVTWGTDVPGMADVVDTMTAARPDLPVSDVYILGWTEGMITQAILEKAAESGDMTRAGIVAAANEVEVDFQGLAPSQSWAGEPNDFVVRESYMYDVSLEQYNPIPLGEGEGSTGWELLEGPFVGSVAEGYDFTEPCFVSG